MPQLIGYLHFQAKHNLYSTPFLTGQVLYVNLVEVSEQTIVLKCIASRNRLFFCFP